MCLATEHHSSVYNSLTGSTRHGEQITMFVLIVVTTVYSGMVTTMHDFTTVERCERARDIVLAQKRFGAGVFAQCVAK